jgi:prolyl-tRNA synthetase
MRFSKGFINTIKEDPTEAEALSHKLMLRAGLIKQVATGIYSYLPLGLKVLNNICSVIRSEFDSLGFSEILLPALLPAEPWKITGRWNLYGKEMYRLKDRRERDFCLGPTHEEIITELVKGEIKSYRDLPLFLYQIQTKYRDEPRPRFGIVRSKEFLMKDLYSFHSSEESLEEGYKLVFEAYKRIFNNLSLSFITMQADPGEIGGTLSHEFVAEASIGETGYIYCKNCSYIASLGEEEDIENSKRQCPNCGSSIEVKIGLEIGHTFVLRDKYSSLLQATFVDQDGTVKPILMGCYGIGVSRIIAALIEENNDKNGIIWPVNLAPYKVNVIPVNVSDEKQREVAFAIYETLSKEGLDPIIDDRSESGGVKFKDSDLLGFPLSLICGRNVSKNEVEIKIRKDGTILNVSVSEAISKVKELLLRNG